MTDYRADHIGSFLRPSAILQARDQADPERLRIVEDENILRILSIQKDIGFKLATDGEFRRRNFMSDFTDAVEGFDFAISVARGWQGNDSASAGARVTPVTGIVTKKLRQVRPLTGHELPFMKAHCTTDIKMTVPSATQFPAISFRRGATDSVYKDYSALLWDVVEIIKAELAMLALGGVKYIQIDAPRYSYYMDAKWRDWIRTEMQMDPDLALDEAIRADSACFQAARQAGVTLGIHLCRGNNRSHWYAEGGYDAIAERLFGSLDVDRFLLEYDDERSGTFAPLRFVPKGKTVVLGLVSSKIARLESIGALAKRIDEAAKFVAIENLALSPQCGFASTSEGNLLTEEDQWAKLRLVVETSRLVWKE